MCKVRDIILVKNYKDNGRPIGRHSFVVISDENGEITGMKYDIICNVLSSFKNEEQKKKKLSYPGNIEIKNTDTITNPDNHKDGYVKTDQLYFFNKNKIDYSVIGTMNEDIFDSILEYIENANIETVFITDNL